MAKFTKTITDDTAYAAMKQERHEGHEALRVAKAPRPSAKGEAALCKLHGKQDYTK
jgi:hypothetical protein